MTKLKVSLILCLNLIAIFSFAQTDGNPHNPKGFKTLDYLYSISGKFTIAGIHNREPNKTPAIWTEEVFKKTGKYPGLWSGDFLFQQENIADRQLMINEAVNQWNKGAVINIMWHACNPALGQPCGWDKQGVLSKLSDKEWEELITDGSALNKRWKAMMDEVAGYLNQLKQQKVEVLFRPLHEMNQGVFWWGGRPGPNGTRRLYQLTHDYLTKTKGLSNLIWVWDIQDFGTLAADAVSYNPGDEYWDIAALDIYDDKSGYSQEKYDIMVKAANGKPIAIGECQKFPTAELLLKQPKWTFFMGWSELVFKENTVDELNKLIHAANVITLDRIKPLKSSIDSQQKVLIFSKTASYVHESIPAGIKAITDLGKINGFSVDETKDPKVFSDANLKRYAAIIFLSPTGNSLDTLEKIALKRFIQAGGGFAGIHAASTTEKKWEWYTELVGAVFTGHPKPQEGVIHVTGLDNPATIHLPKEWKWRDEWYNFDFRAKDLKVLLTVDEKTYQGGTNGEYHPLAWFHEFDGGRSFYTALGHFPEAYQDPLFLKHLLAGIKYAIGQNIKLDYSKVK